MLTCYISVRVLYVTCGLYWGIQVQGVQYINSPAKKKHKNNFEYKFL